MRIVPLTHFQLTLVCCGLLVSMAAGRSSAADSQPVNPPAASAHSASLPDGYNLVTKNDAGQTLATRKPAAQSVAAAMQSALSDLTRFFDGKPKITGAYEDSRNHRSGVASFTAMMRGVPVKGMISCTLGGQGAGLTVIYAQTTATPDDWRKLAAAAPGAAPQIPPLRTYDFPDGTGSIGLAPGWSTQAGSCTDGFVVSGPADQQINVAIKYKACTPDSPIVRQNQQMNTLARQMGGKQYPLQVFVAPLTEPAEVFSKLIRQISQRNLAQHSGPGLALDHVQQVREVQSGAPGGKAALCRYGVTLTAQGQQRHRQALAKVGLEPLGNGNYLLHLTSAAAPDATFQQDLPTMMAIIASLRPNNAVINGQVRQQTENQNRWFEAQQKSSHELSAANDDYNQTIARNSTIQSRSNDNEDEILRGVRTVEDTRTGEKQSVDLGNVDEIVDRLNYNDPGRYRQIPLRDEVDPLPPQ